MAAFILFVMSTLASPALAQDPQWEIMLPDVLGPIAVDPTDSDLIYVATRSSSGGMWKSTDGGQSWESYSEGWAIIPRDIMINPHNPQEILVSGGAITTVLKSTDGGETWMRADKGIAASSHGTIGYQLAYDSRDSTWYVAQDAGGMFGGVFRSKDGVQWESIINFPGLALLLDEEHDDFYAGLTGWAYIARSTDRGQTWEPKHEGLSRRVYHLARAPGSSTLYAAAAGRGIYKSYDRAETWFPVNDTLTERTSSDGGLLVSKADTNNVIAGGRAGIFISFDGGGSWQRYESGLPEIDSTNTYRSVRHLYWDHSSNTLYASISEYSTSNVYRLRIATGTGASPPDEPKPGLPESIELFQNYPNPFNPQTVIEFALPATMQITLQIYDMTGREVETLMDQTMSAGRHQSTWDATNWAAGLYIYRLRAGDVVLSRTLIFLK